MKTLNKYIRKIKGKSLKEILDAILIRTGCEVEWRIKKFMAHVKRNKLSDKEFLNLFNYNSVDDLLYRELRSFFFNPKDREKITKAIREEYYDSIEETIKDADEYCEHFFNFLGSGKVKLGEEIDWHTDFKSGYRWNPKIFYLDIIRKYITIEDDSDIKVPWELSKCQHFVTLGKAYWYTNNEKYAEEFVNEIEDWIDKNQVEFGANWACSMEVAIRAVNWIWGYYFFYDSKILTTKFKIKFFKSLFLHGRHIIENLEFGKIRGNHYLSDIAGLIYIGVFLPKCKETENWLNKGLSALEEEMKFQVHPDGVDFEESISYHRLVTELFLSLVLLCKINNIKIPQIVTERIERMIEFTMYYTKPDGLCPIIGDADDGRLHILSKNKINDHRYLLSIGSVLFNRPEFKSAYPKFNEEAFWLLGIDGLNKFKNLPEVKFGIKSRDFSEGGRYIMRKDRLYMIIDCGGVGLKGYGAHGHCDCLSFELFAHDKTFIQDPGAYVYTSDAKMRNLFRSTKFHNVVVVDNKEMNRFEEDEIFIMKFDAIPKVNNWEVTEEYDIFDGEHSGYERLNEGVIHRRKILFNKKDNYWIMKDILTGKGKHKFDLYFHFAPMNIQAEGLIVNSKCDGWNIAIIPLKEENISLELLDGWVSPSYGIKMKAPVIKYSKTAEVPAAFLTLIYPYEHEIDIKEAKSKYNEFLKSLKSNF